MIVADIARAGCRVIGVAALLAAASCQRPQPATNVANAAPAPIVATPAPRPTVSTPTVASASLAGYAGKYPFDKVNGTAFLDTPAVTGAVNRLIDDISIRKRLLNGDGPGTPIARRDGKLLAWGCETHNCGDHNWTVLIAPDGSAAQVCYHDAAAMQERSRWYADAATPAMRDGACPSA